MKLENIIIKVDPISAEMTIDQVADLLLQDNEYSNLLSLPVVLDDKPVGIVSRYQLMNVFMKRFGRDLYGSKTVAELMNPRPVVVNINNSIESTSQFITKNMNFPITEDFILTQDENYLGVGVVLDLLRQMENNVEAKNRDLSRALSHLKESQTQLVQSEKMASLGQMVAGVAHEINTPLGYVKGNVEMVREVLEQMHDLAQQYQKLMDVLSGNEIELDALSLSEHLAHLLSLNEEINPASLLLDVGEIFDDTMYGIEQINELVASLKDFSRLDKAKTDNVDLNECIENSLLIANNTLKYRVEVIKKLGSLPKLKCSPSQINQVILNLLTNAAHAINDYGKVLVKSYVEGSHAVIIVEDNGKGISKQNLSRVFDPFFTTKEVGKGTGMGLSISFKIIKDHGGSISVASKEGVGTRFTIKLPFLSALQIAS